MPKTCPGCGNKASGKFCSHCGGSLDETRQCTGCGNTIPQGGRFCNMCGTPVLAGSAPDGQPSESKGMNAKVPWFIAGAALLALVVAIVAPRFTTPDPAPVPAPPITGPAAGGAGGTPPDLSSMTPREAADRLFNRVMESVSAGDTAQALQFAPMAISAYGMVDALDADGLYHLAVLQLVSSQPEEARATAEQILGQTPDHLFGLFTAAQAETILGNEEEATSLYSRFLENYDAELAQGRPEYAEHSPVLPSMRQEALQRTGGAP